MRDIASNLREYDELISRINPENRCFIAARNIIEIAVSYYPIACIDVNRYGGADGTGHVTIFWSNNNHVVRLEIRDEHWYNYSFDEDVFDFMTPHNHDITQKIVLSTLRIILDKLYE